MDMISQSGFSKPLMSVTKTNQSELVASIVLYHLMIKVKSSMDQFLDGLQSISLLNLLRDDPEVWKPLFVNEKSI